MTMTMDVNKITRFRGLTIMQASKNFKSNRLLRIFGSSDIILKIGDIHESTGEEWILVKCEKLFVGVFRLQRTTRAVGTRYFWNNRENFGVSCNNKINWE